MAGGEIWSDDNIQILIDNYGKVRLKDLKLLLPHRTNASIGLKARKLGLKGSIGLSKKIYFYDENYFSNPTIENAYWAGLIAADGSLSSHKSKNNYVIRIRLSSKDRITLEKFKEHINYTGPIHDFPVTDKRTGNTFDYSEIRLYRTSNYYDDLYKYWNIIPENKTYDLLPPKIDDFILSLAYFIGFFDGDGCWQSLNTNGKNCYEFSVSGTEEMMYWVKNLMDSIIPETKNIKICHYPKHCNNYIYKAGGKRAFDLREKIKKMIDIPWKMSRKWDS